MVIGDKSKGQLARVVGTNMALTFNQIGRDIPTFADAARVANLIMQSGVEHNSISIVYNKILSAISYEPAIVEVANEKIPKESRQSLHSPSSWLTIYQQDSVLTKWRMISPRILTSFSLANAIYSALVEAHACEQSAR